MEFSITLIFMIVLSLAITISTWKIVNWIWLRPKRLERRLREQGLKGNPYRLLFGDVKDNFAMLKEARSKSINIDDDITPRVFPFPLKTVEKYGKNSFVWMGRTPRVNITNPEDLKDIFSKIGDFRKPESNPLVRLVANGLANFNGQKWAKHRKIISPVFYVEKLKLMLPTFYLSCDEMLNKWERSINQNGEGRCEIDVWPDLQDMSADVISRTAFGSSHKEGRKIFELQKEQFEHLMSLQTIYVPGWRFVPTKFNKRIKENDNEIQRLLKTIINKREKAMEIGEAPNNDDLLGILMESNHREIKENDNKKGNGMSIEDVIGECKLFYFAGQETTSVLLVWTMILLSRFPNWQTEAREEVLSVFGNNNPDFDGLAHLKVVTMILNEVLRLYPPVVAVFRTVHKEIKLGNLTLPAGVQVSMPAILVHRDTELWGEDAKEFKPERFAQGVSNVTKGRVSFFPFSWGPRVCIGQNFSMTEAKMALALILRRFTFELSPSYAHAPMPIVTLQPQHGAHLILHKR